MEEDPLAGHPLLRTVRVLGRSASNVVVLASNSVTGELVAVKLIPRGFDSRQAKYLLRELLNHYELTLAKHPHIVSLLDCFLTPRHLAIVLEYVDGENVQVFLEKAGGCTIEPLARFLFQQLVIALDFCHRRGKVNRNIKPGGLLLQLSASALPLLKIADFSMSKDTLRNSEPRSQVGTAMYCAPEVLQNFTGAPYDAAAADMWAVGVVLFMMLFGRHPFSRPEDAELPAQQQVIAMFKRVTAPHGSYDGDLYVPHVLPTSVLPGAQPGGPLSLAGADLLRGLLARDPRVRMTLASVQMHEWFRTGLPEGAALLNEVVAAEEAAAGAAAVMPPSVAAQLERMVVLAAAGPAAASPLAEAARTESGDAGGCGGSGGGGPPGHAAAPGGGGAVPYPPSTPPGPGAQQHPPAQGPVVVRTITTVGSAEAALQSVSIGAAGPQAGSGAMAATVSSTGTAVAEPAALVSPQWSPVDSATGQGGTAEAATAAAAAAAAGGGNGDSADLLADLEAMVMGISDDDILTAASLDFLMGAVAHQQHHQQGPCQQEGQYPHDHYQGQRQGQPPNAMQDEQRRRQLSNSTFAMPGGSAPVSTDTLASAPSPAHSALPVQTPMQQPSNADASAVPLRSTTFTELLTGPSFSAATHPPPPPLPHHHHLQPHIHDGPDASSFRPTGRSPPPPLDLYTSLHTAAATAGTASNSGCVAAGPGDVAASLLMRLNTESLPSPTTLAVVDAQPFLARNLSGLCDRRGSSMATIPSTYSMDWCTLSARSQTLLSPKAGAAGGPSGSGLSALMQSSLWHRICNDARGALSGVAAEAREMSRTALSRLGRP